MPKLVEPLQYSVAAKPHRPIYRMHRYFARRPYSVFAELVRHYSSPNDVILDPFCGGGVTLVEGVLQGRRVIGFDINPLATFITRMQLADVDLDELREVQAQVCADFAAVSDRLFNTTCRRCATPTPAQWFEYSAIVECPTCLLHFSIATATKQGVGLWACPSCNAKVRFSPNAQTPFQVLNVLCKCSTCGYEAVELASDDDALRVAEIDAELDAAVQRGLWLPDAAIPDCNMQRESALFKKGFVQFHQLFTNRHLLALGLLRELILQQSEPWREWLLLAFSSTLRYTNRMVTRNPEWRGNRPLEWAKPGFWLPPVHLEANVLEEFRRRCDAVWRGKRDYLTQLSTDALVYQPIASDVVVNPLPSFHVATQSVTKIPLPDTCVDVIITDPPYGSYVHYADLSNFWAVWLPVDLGFGGTIDNGQEAVIARKQFPGAKSAADYQQLLEQCFGECMRVLKPGGYMVLTFHNREPRAWVALLVAATKVGFDLPLNGVIFQDGIPSYRHTAQSRRAGSVIGDFIFSFCKPEVVAQHSSQNYETYSLEVSEQEFISMVKHLLQVEGPQTPNALMARLYLELQPRLLRHIRATVAQGEPAIRKLIEDFDGIQLFDSHRRQLLETHFAYQDGQWSLKAAQ